MDEESGSGAGFDRVSSFAQILRTFLYEQWIQHFEDLRQEFARQAEDRRDDRKKQLADMIQSVAYDLGRLKARLLQMRSIRQFTGKPSVVVGYHGTTLEMAQRVKKAADRGEPNPFISSQNDWDWLGHGVYFWLEAPRRAAEYARWWYRIVRKQKPHWPDLFDHTLYPPPQGHRSHSQLLKLGSGYFPRQR